MVSLFKIGLVVLERKVLEFVNVFPLLRNYLHLERSGNLHLKKLESFSPKDALCQVFFYNIGLVVLTKKMKM